MNESFENDPWALLEAEIAADPTLQESSTADDVSCPFDLAAVPGRIEVEAVFDRFNLRGESWEWMGVRNGAFGHDGKEYRLEILAPKSPDFTLSNVIDDTNLPIQPGQLDDDLILAILSALPDCRVASHCLRADTASATVWYAALEPKPGCNRSRFIVLHRQTA